MSINRQADRAELMRSFYDASNILRASLQRSRQVGCLGPFVIAIGEILCASGFEVDRVNLPATKLFGFHHPLYAHANITWVPERDHDNITWIPERDVDVEYIAHSERELTYEEMVERITGSPYEPIFRQEQVYVRLDLKQGEYTYPLLQNLQSQGYEDYLGIGLSLPNGTAQPISIASRRPFPPNIIESIDLIRPLLSLTLDSLYQGYAASSLAQSYIGNLTGPRVLAGDFVRGRTQMIKAGILFCDIRGFTALSERLGAAGVVSVVNQIFEIIGQVVYTHGGEILKFIGDAVLIIFSDQDEEQHQAMIESMIDTVRDATQEVETLGDQLKLPLAIGFGGHIGDVLYGNIGAPMRLDFTVMGPAVNLASRLESLCKKFNVSAVFSSEVAQGEAPLKPLGSEPLKGITEPVQVWGLVEQSST